IRRIRGQINLDDEVRAVRFDCIHSQPDHRQLRPQIAGREIEVNEFFEPLITDFHKNFDLLTASSPNWYSTGSVSDLSLPREARSRNFRALTLPVLYQRAVPMLGALM